MSGACTQTAGRLLDATATDAAFSARVLAWFDRHGRTDLPWQRQPTAYRVWVSEIMLQQTRVSVVVDYYQRFMTRFPSIAALADAPQDEVLHLWSGLGYYARARNLQRTAQLLRNVHDGEFPASFDQVAALPGIGRSTAGAILALSRGERHAILDGNVKRVLARYHAIDGWPGTTAVAKRLWSLAEGHTPETRVAAYSQAMMDLGATLCTRSRPRCSECPVASDCAALGSGRVAQLPAPKPRRAMPVRTTRMLLLCAADGAVLLQRRPPAGIWGGLWSFPQCPPEADPATWCRSELGLAVEIGDHWPTLRHTFSHFHLDITPVLARARTEDGAVMEAGQYVWYNGGHIDRLGLAAPVQRLLNTLHQTTVKGADA